MSRTNQTQKTVYLINISELGGHLAQENPNQVTWLPVRFMRLHTSLYFIVHFPYPMSVPVWLGKKIQ